MNFLAKPIRHDCMHLRLTKLLVPFLLVALGLFVAIGCKKSGGSASGQKYHCPMHPTYIADRPDDCPICGMKLVPIKDDKAAPAGASAKPKATSFTCPMHPNVVSKAQGTCPECNMKLVPAKGSNSSDHSAHAGEDQAGQEGHVAPPAATPAVPGRIAISLSADKQQLIGLRLSPVEVRELAEVIRATGVVQHDETRLARIAPRFSGWVRELKVNYTGQAVQKGEPLLTVYSPDLLSAENEYLLAFAQFEKLKDKTSDPQYESAQRLAESARRRLSLWQIGDEEIRAMEQTRQPQDEVLVRAPFSGHVVSKTAIAGKAFMAGETLYEIADLSHLWVRASVFEFEFGRIQVGQKARLTFPYLGNKTLESSITFLYPHIDPQTRRGAIRLEFDNPEHRMRPDMWANVEIDLSAGKVLAVPASAVIDTGQRYVAFVKREDGHLEPRELKIGTKTDDYYQVLSGVKEGEQVVTRALFLVDSESQLKASISGMGAAGEHQH